MIPSVLSSPASECEWGVSPDVDWYGMGSTAPHKSWIRWAFVLRPYPTLTRPEPGSNTLLPSVLQGPQARTQLWHTYLRLTFPGLRCTHYSTQTNMIWLCSSDLQWIDKMFIISICFTPPKNYNSSPYHQSSSLLRTFSWQEDNWLHIS